MSPKNVLGGIKENLDSFVGKRISLRTNKGRKQVIEENGILEKTYPHIFVVKLEENLSQQRVTYSYADVLTETVEIMIHGDKGIKKIGFAREEKLAEC